MNVNAVDVNGAAIDAALLGLEGGASAGSASAPELEQPAAQIEITRIAVDWDQALQGAMELLDKIVAPNWELTAAEKQVIVSSGAKTLEAFFPNLVLEGKWLALAMFAITSGTIVLKRFDADELAFRPLRMQKAKPASAADHVPPASNQQPAPADENRVAAAPWANIRAA